MLYVQEKAVKLGGIYLEGQLTSVEVQSAGSVYVAQDEKGRCAKSQPVGYENAKVLIDILLEDTNAANTLEQIAKMQGLFKAPGQDKPNLIGIVNEDCAARGITSVYFKSFTTKKVISESKRIAALELWAPDTAEIQVTKRAVLEDNQTEKTSLEKPGIEKAAKKSSRTVKPKNKSPAKDSRDTTEGRKAAKACCLQKNRRRGN